MEVKGLVQAFFGRYGEALGAGDLDSVVSCWGLPALVLSDEGALAVENEEQIREFFGRAIEGYRAQGLEATHPSSVRTVERSPRVVDAEVEWVALDGEGKERTRERVGYLLRLDDEGGPRIHVISHRPALAGGE